MTKLSETQSMILLAAAQHETRLARAPKGLPAAARNAVFRSLIKNNLLTEINAPRKHVGLGWRQDDDGTWIVARITDEGMRAIGLDPNEGDAVAHRAPRAASDAAAGESSGADADAAQAAPQTPAAPVRAGLRDAALTFLAAWDACPNEDATSSPISKAVETLRASLAGKPRETSAPRKPREGTKQETVLALLRRPEGATVAQIAEATGWQQHTVRGFFAGLKKRQGIAVEVMERVRQVGPNNTGAKGSYSIYRIAEAN
ncbi:DUF3489 domain-containing protein [Roseomonas sp. F4]